MRRIPIISTLVVLAAVCTMIALGFWQLRRLDEKEALLAQYEAARGNREVVAFPLSGTGEDLLFRRSSIKCDRVIAIEPRAGRSAQGESGWAQRVSCTNGDSDAVLVADIGWTRSPEPVEWSGGVVEGVVAQGPRLIADSAPATGLEPLAAPDPAEIPNNHLSYAVQWFLFALTALVIYALALRKRWRASEE